MMRSRDDREERRRSALTEFLDERVREGYRVETRTDTHAIIGPGEQRRSILELLRRQKRPLRQVVSVDRDGEVSMCPAEPLRF